MKVVATIAAVGKGLKSACAVKITSDKFTHTRVLPFTKATVNQAELFALGYVLTAIKPELNNVDFEITTSNQYVGRILDRDAQGQYAVTPEKNIEQVKEIRDIAAIRPRITLLIEKSEEVMNLRDMIKKTVEPVDAK